MTPEIEMPVAPVTLHESVADWPWVIVAGLAEKEEMTGATVFGGVELGVGVGGVEVGAVGSVVPGAYSVTGMELLFPPPLPIENA